MEQKLLFEKMEGLNTMTLIGNELPEKSSIEKRLRSQLEILVNRLGERPAVLFVNSKYLEEAKSLITQIREELGEEGELIFPLNFEPIVNDEILELDLLGMTQMGAAYLYEKYGEFLKYLQAVCRIKISADKEIAPIQFNPSELRILLLIDEYLKWKMLQEMDKKRGSLYIPN